MSEPMSSERDSELEAELSAVRETTRRFIKNEIAPHYRRWERAGAIPRDLWRKMGAAGLLCTSMPEAYGGIGARIELCLVIIEEFAKAFVALPGFYTHSEIIAPYILHYGSESQKRKWLPGCVSGDTVLSVAMTEPGAGSDLRATRTTARRDGDNYVVNGQKTFISNGLHADLIIVFANADDTEPGRKSLFLVDGRTGLTQATGSQLTTRLQTTL